MGESEPIVIVGAGQAGFKAAETLRQKGYDGALVLVGAEPHLPYQRPPLSKGYLKGDLDEDRLAFRAPEIYAEEGIDCLLDARVEALDAGRRRVRFASGKELAFSRLLLATGSFARPLAVPGAALGGIHSLRTLDDVTRLRGALAAARRVVVIGGGYVGLEFAAVARALGHEVAVVEAGERVMARSVAPEVSRFFADAHRDHGVDLRLGIGVSALVGEGHVSDVALADGAVLPADLVLSAVGGAPAVGLAAAAGLVVSGGISVDAACRTSAPFIYAAGDCTDFPSARYGRRVRLESVQNAVDQGKAAALAMLGEEVRYDPVPWFWSDQYDLKLQIAGLSAGHDQAVVEGDPSAPGFSVSYFRGGRLLAVDAVNAPRAHMMARRQLEKDTAPA